MILCGGGGGGEFSEKKIQGQVFQKKYPGQDKFYCTVRLYYKKIGSYRG